MQTSYLHIFRRCATCRTWHQQGQMRRFHVDALRTPRWMPIRIKIHWHDRFLYLCKDCAAAKGKPKKASLRLIPGARTDLDVIGPKGSKARHAQRSIPQSQMPTFICRLCGHQAAHFSHLQLHMAMAHEGAAVDELAEAMETRVRVRQDAAAEAHRKQVEGYIALTSREAGWQEWNVKHPIPSGAFSPR